MDNATLDDWIGKQVGVVFMMKDEDDEQRGASCTLESADERGVMLSYHHAEDLSQQLWFCPWHRIEWIHRLTQ